MTPNQFMKRWLLVDVVFILFLLWAYSASEACGEGYGEPETVVIEVSSVI
ncbi:MAG: hypothetical protein NUV74_05465 [Candidatus Brocadiaceae bacterium]|nr:hypothetical protein [Candidatus Brocadiaceae bacterium]